MKLAERVFGNLKGHNALIVGAGAVAEQVVEHLRNRGIGSLRVVNRSHDHAAELAARMGGEAVAWASLEEVLGTPDIIVTSVSSGAVLTREMLDGALAARGGRPVFLVDLGVPRNVDSDAADLYNLYLYNIDDLGEIVEQNKRAREAEIPRAEAIISEHLAKFESWRAALEAGSIVDDLRGQFRKHRELLLRERLANAENISPEEQQRLASITEELIERVLDEPAQRLRRGGEMRARLSTIESIRHIFGLDKSGAKGRGRRVKRLRIGTRGSSLALWQANHVADLLAQRHGIETELVRIRTAGDRLQSAPVAQVNAAIGSESGAKGIFIKELEEALLAGSIDLAVHSMKDVPTEIPAGLVFAAITRREDPRDCLISRDGATLETLAPGARVGTSSLRRQAQLRHHRPDIEVVDLRGNVDTRLRKLDAGKFDAIVLAVAGVNRLGLTSRITRSSRKISCSPP